MWVLFGLFFMFFNTSYGVGVRACLGYGEEVHWSVKNFESKTRLFEARVRVVDKMRKQFKFCFKMDSSGGQVSCRRV